MEILYAIFSIAPKAAAAAVNPEELFERWVEPKALPRRPSPPPLIRRNAMRRLCVIDHPHLYRPPTPPLGYTRAPQARVAEIF